MYVTPEVELISAQVEAGFANSGVNLPDEPEYI